MSRTFLSLEGDYSSTCGYCRSGDVHLNPGFPGNDHSSSKTGHSYGIFPMYTGLSCTIYMAMIDRGWRRSGEFLYKPSMEITCCPQYTIRLDALQFLPSRSQRQITNRWNRFVVNGDRKGDDMEVEDSRKDKGKGKAKTPTFDLVTAIHSSEVSSDPDVISEHAHRFKVTLEPSALTHEKFMLYQAYQRDIHKETKEKDVSSFERFLVTSPLLEEPIPYPTPPPAHLPNTYGSYHQCYRMDGELIAMAVLDILPRCVSSVYFMYDSRWERFSLGKLSALREAALAREIHDAGIASMGYLYMGFYVHSCVKMRYKADYAPSYLLDPETYTWFPYKNCIPLLDKRRRYACFSHPDHSRDEDVDSPEVLEDITPEVLENIQVLQINKRTRRASISSVMNDSRFQEPEIQELLLRGIRLLGPEIAQQVVLHL